MCKQRALRLNIDCEMRTYYSNKSRCQINKHLSIVWGIDCTIQTEHEKLRRKLHCKLRCTIKKYCVNLTSHLWITRNIRARFGHDFAQNRRGSCTASITNDSGNSLGTVRPLCADNLSRLWIRSFRLVYHSQAN